MYTLWVTKAEWETVWIFGILIAVFIVVVVWIGISSRDDEAFRFACYEAGGYPLLSTSLGDVCVTEMVDLE